MDWAYHHLKPFFEQEGALSNVDLRFSTDRKYCFDSCCKKFFDIVFCDSRAKNIIHIDITVVCNYISIVVENSLVQSTWGSWCDALGSSKEVVPFEQREKFFVFLKEVRSFKVDSYECLNCSSEWLSTAARSIGAKNVTGDQEVQCISNKAESSS